MIRKLWRTLRGKRLYQDVDDELQFHLDHRREEWLAAGATPAEAERQVQLRFGNRLQVEERTASADILGSLSDILRDFRYGLRNLRRNPGFAVVAVATLAIGIGAATAVFSIVNGVLFEALPFQDPRQLVLMFERLPGMLGKAGFSPPDFEIVQRGVRSFTGIAVYRNVDYEISGIGEPRRLVGARVSPELFPVLGVAPAIGRTISFEDDRQNATVVVLGYRLWSALGRDPSLVGRTLLLDRRPYTIIGVMPARFDFPQRGAALNGEPAELFVPISFSRSEREGFGMRYNHTVVGRLRPGVSIDQARAEMESLRASFAQYYPAVLQGLASGMAFPIVPLDEETAGRSRNMLLVLMGAVAIVLLIVCADVANLMLTRFGSRKREISVRSSLGASSARIVRQLVAESLALASLGSVFGLVFAWFAMRALLVLAAGTLPRAESIAFNGRVLWFAVLLALATPLLFGVLPAFRSAAGTGAGALKDSPRTATASRKSSRLLGTLAVTQVALALVLSVGAGLLVRSFLRLLSIDPGFRPEKSVLLQVTLPSGGYTQMRQMLAFCDRAVQALHTVPGILEYGVGSDMPLGVRERRAFTPEGPARQITGPDRTIAVTWASPGYFAALGIPLERGRRFNEADGPDRPAVIVNHKLAEMLWPGEDPVGRRLKWGIEASRAPWMTIVGVAGDVKQSTLDEPAIAQVYAPLTLAEAWSRTFNIVARSERNPSSVIADLRRVVQQIDPSLPVNKAQPLEEMIGESLRPRRFSMTVVTLFAAVALALAAIGIYGVLSSLVSQQTRDIAIRMALGASASGVIWMVLRRALILMTAGIAFGIAGALGITRVMAGLLYGVRPTDAIAFLGAAVVLTLFAMIASLAPAWRAIRVDPIVALKTE